MKTKELTRTAVIALIFFGIGAAAAESNLHIFKLRADEVLTDYIGGNATADKVNITGLVIQAGQVFGYYNGSVTDGLLKAKANQSDLTAHSGNVTGNPHNVTSSQVGAAASSHGHDASNITSGTIDDNILPSTMSGKTLTSPIITTPDLTLSTSTSTSSGGMAYDAAGDRIAVGDGTAVDYFYSGDHTTDTDTWITTQTCSADYALQSVGKTSKTCINKVDYSDVAYDVNCTNCLTGNDIDEASLSGTASSLTAGYASSAGDANTLDGIDSTAFAKITSGTYSGNGTNNRAIAHGLGRTPKFVNIGSVDMRAVSGDQGHLFSLWSTDGSKFMYDDSGGIGSATVSAWTSTNFYVGGADIDYTGNVNGVVYYWVAIG